MQIDRDIRVERSDTEADPRNIVGGIVRLGLKPPAPREAISLRVDSEVPGWFRAKEPGWQTRINDLGAYKEAACRSRSLTSRST
jgi:uncharacterized protein (DUF4415 family)